MNSGTLNEFFSFFLIQTKRTKRNKLKVWTHPKSTTSQINHWQLPFVFTVRKTYDMFG